MDLDDTIVAIASAPGGALRGVVRVSGPQAMLALDGCFLGENQPTLANIREPIVIRGNVRLGDVNRNLPGELYLWPDHRSYTGQPSAEFHTIGSTPLLEAMIRTLTQGAVRVARPGEFTMRAFLAGRLDLTQAEAVLGVIDATDRVQADAALRQLGGGVARPLHQLRDRLMNLLADLEAGLDFVEDDIAFVESAKIASELTAASNEVTTLLTDMRERSVSQHEFRIVMTGRPNVGKSSLLNALAGEQKAIVADLSGTTRDYVEHPIEIANRSCLLIDTAGRDEHSTPELSVSPHNELDLASQEAACTQVEEGHLQLLCIDASSPISEWDKNQLQTERDDRLVVLTKCDRASSQSVSSQPMVPDGISTSSETGEGLDELISAIANKLESVLNEQSRIVASTAARCHQSLANADVELSRALAATNDESGEEIVAFEIRQALHSLGEVVGSVYTDDILDRVFSRFCIGK